MTATVTSPLGAALDRLEGGEKVTGKARYAYEYPLERMAYAAAVQAGVPKAKIRSIERATALSSGGVLAVIAFDNAPTLRPVENGELALFQSNDVAYRGQFVAAVVAESLEQARRAASLVEVDYEPQTHDVELTADHPGLYKPDVVNPAFATDTESGDFDEAFAKAPLRVDETYTTPATHNNPMEPHATIAVWDGDRLTLYDSNQGTHAVRDTVAQAFGLAPEHVRVISPHVGGGFGSKGTPRPSVILAAMASLVTGRPVKVAVTRQQMFAVVGYRTPTIQRLRLGCDRDGRLTAICHDVIEQTSTVHEFAEQTAVATRHMYGAEALRTTHRLARLDVPTPSWMRAPGECPGMYALESAIDELAIARGVDPIELRLRNEAEGDQQGRPFSSRNLAACLTEGANRFGWEKRDPTPRARRDGDWLVGTGVAASTYPAYLRPSTATARIESNGMFTVLIAAEDIGTGARTVLTQIAADALGTGPDGVRVEIGDSALPAAPLAGGSLGTASWGFAVTAACRSLLSRLESEHTGRVPPEGLEASADTTDDVSARAALARHAFGAQFAEVRVNRDTGEVRVPRALGVFAAGRIINPKTARSQLIGGMTMGISMALHEESVMDHNFGEYVNHDLATYHICANADIEEIEATWVDEDDRELNPMGSKGIGEIGIVGTAACVANAVYHATAIRVRDLPIRLDRLVR